MAARGLRKGDVFAILAPNLPEYVVAFHAETSLGGAVTTINPLFIVDELAHQLSDAGATWLLTAPDPLGKARACAQRVAIHWTLAIRQG